MGAEAVLHTCFSMDEIHQHARKELEEFENSLKDPDTWLSDYANKSVGIIIEPYFHEGLSFYLSLAEENEEIDSFEGVMSDYSYGNFAGPRSSFEALSQYVEKMFEPMKDRISSFDWAQLRKYCKDSKLPLKVVVEN